MANASIKQTLDLLISEYGERDWRPHDSPLNVLVQTILSQNTSDANSRRAFHSLLTSFLSWEEVASADVYQIASAIKGGGLSEVKAHYIKRVLGEIQRKRGRLELDFLRSLPLEEARDWLMRLPGVGTKTANCVFLFSLGRPALPVDTHVYRVARRLGLIDAKATVEKAHKILESLVPAEKVYAFHVLMIEHGRKVCQAQRPRCSACTLRKHCAYFQQSQPAK
jgi:endonuclease-3